MAVLNFFKKLFDAFERATADTSPKLPPDEALAYEQGHASIPGKSANPYPPGSRQHKCWQDGQAEEEMYRRVW